MSNDLNKYSSIDPIDVKNIVEGFKDHSLPAEDWTHEAHLVTGLTLVMDYGLQTAEGMMPGMIRSFNEAKGGVNSDTEGYHHTITIFYLRVLDRFRRENAGLDRVPLMQNMLNSPVAAKMYPLNFYSNELLFSVKARRDFVEPDLQEF